MSVSSTEKIALRRQLEQDAQETEGELMFSACGESSFAVPLSVYEYFAENIRDRLPNPEAEAGRWLRVDAGYAESLI